jgi:hypothetical protein
MTTRKTTPRRTTAETDLAQALAIVRAGAGGGRRAPPSRRTAPRNDRRRHGPLFDAEAASIAL